MEVIPINFYKNKDVVNRRYKSGPLDKDTYYLYSGRCNKGITHCPFGNFADKGGSREENIENFRNTGDFVLMNHLLDVVKELGYKRVLLGCSCLPKACHTEVIRDNWYKYNKNRLI